MDTKKSQDKMVEERTLFDTLGDELRRERQKKGVDIETVSRALNIRPSFVEALENNDYSVFPAEVYGIGFLRSYGNYLGLNGDKVVQKYKEQIVKKELNGQLPTKAEKDVLPQKTTVVSAVILILIIVIGVLFFTQQGNLSFSSTQPQTRIPAIDIKTEQPIVTAFIETEITVSDRIDTISDMRDVVTEYVPTLEEQVKSKFSDITGTLYGTPNLETPIVLVAKDRVWIDVKEKDTLVFDQVLMRGDAYFVPPSETDLTMRTGNARALFVYINGMPKGIMSKKETVKNNIILKPETFENK